MIDTLKAFVASAWIQPPAFNDRRIQACVTVIFCMGMIVWSAHQPASAVNDRIIDWSYISILAVVGVYHIARGVDETFGRSRK